METLPASVTLEAAAKSRTAREILEAIEAGEPELVAFVREHRSRLDHLLFDVGLDYRAQDGRVEILKSGYYAFF